MQPRVGINLDEVRKSYFSEIFAGGGGVDSYTNAISDTYQDNFGEGIYTGKGIYDVQVFCEVLDHKIPENTVLSHDLLEGCYLRCGLASDIMLLDGYPKSFLAFLNRLHRWIRGDYQILDWLLKKDLNKLSKFKILDNIRRSLLEISVIFGLLVMFIGKIFGIVKSGLWMFLAIILISIVSPSIIEIINYIIFRKENIKKQRKFTKSIDGLYGSFYRAFINLSVLPTKAYMSLDALVRTVYRKTVSKEHMLEWTTSKEAEIQSKNTIKNNLIFMLPNIILGILFIAFGIFGNFGLSYSILLYVLAFIFCTSPFVMWYISKDRIELKMQDKLSDEEQAYVIDIAKKTWGYFEEYMNSENSFMPPDNFQESRRVKVANRTSSTNIGLGVLGIISAYDLKFIDLDRTIIALEDTISTIEKLKKWNRSSL